MTTTTVLLVSLDIDMKKVLFVCTGNTCRSPMAEAVFNSIVEKNKDFCAFSRGLFADGSPLSDNARAVLKENGIQFNHTSHLLTGNDIDCANIIFGMTRRHGQAVLDKFPNAAGKVFLMPSDIFDPYGADIEVYRKCFNQIKEAIEYILPTLGIL